MAFLDRIKKAIYAFAGQDSIFGPNVGSGHSARPDRTSRGYRGSDKSIVTSVYNRIAMDVAGVLIKHVAVDEKGRYKADMESALNDCFTLAANIDQEPRAFRQDICMTMFETGSAAIVPIRFDTDEFSQYILDVYEMRVGEITNWHAKHVRISVWNADAGVRQEVTFDKRFVAIPNNPLYSVMNEPNSTMQRLIRKLGYLDTVDEAISSGKLDLIIQLPYVIKTEARRQQAEQRREQIEFQLKGSKYGIAYTDGTEKIIQLNRPSENNLLKQVEYLVDMLFGQLGITPQVMNGTADEATMINYYGRTVYPIVDSIVESLRRTFLGKEGLDRNENIRYFREPFKFVTMEKFAEISDSLRRNEVLTSNELRDVIGLPPNEDEQADKLSNPNMPQPETQPVQEPERNSQNGT